MASSERNAEIWSTRLQREILALESNDDDSKKMELLPPFIKTLGHTLNIEGGIAKIEFRIDVELAEKLEEEENAAAEGGDADKNETGAEEGDKADEAKENVADESTAETDDAAAPSETAPTETNEANSPETIADPHVILVLDASMYWKSHDASSEQSKSPQFYPFTKPLAVIKAGTNLFTGGSTIGNGDEVDIDLDWTPR